MSIPKVRIKQDCCSTFVYINGKEVHGVRGIHFDRTVDNNAPILRLDILAVDMELDCVAIPELPEIFKPFYERKEVEEEYEDER